jgi:predicted enzyme related to lactoylglutathione lyase
MKVTFSSVLIGVKDILKSKVFYENVFGVTFDEVRPPFSNFYLNGIEFMVEEHSPERSNDWTKRYVGREMGVCLQTENINLYFEEVVVYGGTIIKEAIKKPWGSIEGKFTDLDGNIFIIEQNS